MYELLNDDQTVFVGTFFECVRWIHKHHDFSFGHAVKHEGFSVRAVTTVQEALAAVEQPWTGREEFLMKYCDRPSGDVTRSATLRSVAPRWRLRQQDRT